MKTRIAYYYANAVYTDEDADGLFHTRYGKLTSTNRGCTKIEILDVNIGKKYFELLVCYPGLSGFVFTSKKEVKEYLDHYRQVFYEYAAWKNKENSNEQD